MFIYIHTPKVTRENVRQNRKSCPDFLAVEIRSKFCGTSAITFQNHLKISQKNMKKEELVQQITNPDLPSRCAHPQFFSGEGGEGGAPSHC